MADGEHITGPVSVGEAGIQVDGDVAQAPPTAAKLDPGTAFMRTSRQAILSCVGAAREEFLEYEAVAHARVTGQQAEAPTYD